MYRSGFTALCKNLLLNEIHEVHLRNARLISSPLTDEQKTLWNVELGEELALFADDQEKEKILQQFWTQMNTPVDTDDDLPSITRKRRMSQHQGDVRLIKRQREDSQ